jgi:integrase
MKDVSFYLKDPQTKTIPSLQKESLIFMFFSYGYFEYDNNGNKKYKRLKYSTGIKVFPYLWNGKSQSVRKNELVDYERINKDLELLMYDVKLIQSDNPTASPDLLRKMLDRKRNRTDFSPNNLNSFIQEYLHDTLTGKRLTIKGERYKVGTVKAIKGFYSLFKKYQEAKNRVFDFNEIDMNFYNDFISFLIALNYSPNTIGRHIKHLKTIMREARNEKLHSNFEIDNKAFKVITKKVESIYLSEEELKCMLTLDLTDKPRMDIARDVFLVGCYTAQRYSDYSVIRKTNIKNGFIHLIQIKTQEKVIIPIRSELDQILRKYDYTLPKTYEQKVNQLIKEVGKLSGINDLIKMEKTRGGRIIKEDLPKYKLITTHTARRSGATNMYLSGISSLDIMRITGHKSEKEFLKYIKVTKEETAKNLSNHPYFS